MKDLAEFAAALIGALLVIFVAGVIYGAIWAIPIAIVVLALRALGVH